MVRIGSVELGEFPLLLAPMEDVSDPPFRTLCKKARCGYDVHGVHQLRRTDS